MRLRDRRARRLRASAAGTRRRPPARRRGRARGSDRSPPSVSSARVCAHDALERHRVRAAASRRRSCASSPSSAASGHDGKRRILVVGPRVFDRLELEAREHLVEHARHFDRVRQHEAPAVGGHEQPRRTGFAARVDPVRCARPSTTRCCDAWRAARPGLRASCAARASRSSFVLELAACSADVG